MDYRAEAAPQAPQAGREVKGAGAHTASRQETLRYNVAQRDSRLASQSHGHRTDQSSQYGTAVREEMTVAPAPAEEMVRTAGKEMAGRVMAGRVMAGREVAHPREIAVAPAGPWEMTVRRQQGRH